MSLCDVAFQGAEPSSAPEADARTKLIVLLVEDEEPLAVLLVRVLERMNLHVVHAGDGATALRLLAERADRFALALIDCLLPDMNGCELACGLRERSAGLPLLLMSGRDHRAWVNTLADGGPTVFLAKPYGPADVLREVNALLSRPS